jgi:hypothetical protein
MSGEGGEKRPRAQSSSNLGSYAASLASFLSRSVKNLSLSEVDHNDGKLAKCSTTSGADGASETKEESAAPSPWIESWADAFPRNMLEDLEQVRKQHESTKSDNENSAVFAVKSHRYYVKEFEGYPEDQV